MALFGREFGSKIGGGDIASDDLLKLQRKERMRAIASEMFDLKNDPYLFRNHLGQFECRLCSTPHPSEANYMIHTQGKRHNEALAKRTAMLNRQGKNSAGAPLPEKQKALAAQRGPAAPAVPRIGRPAYKVIKQLDRGTHCHSMLFRIEYPRILDGLRPRFRLMSSFEQRVEPPSDRHQYILFAAEPYEVIAFKVPADKVDAGGMLAHWDEERAVFTLQVELRDGDKTKKKQQQMQEQQQQLQQQQQGIGMGGGLYE